MRGGLDLARAGGRRRRGRWLLALLLAAVLARCMPFAAAFVLRLADPRDAGLRRLQAENAALRHSLAALEAAAEPPSSAFSQNTTAAVLLERRPDVLVLVCHGGERDQTVLDAEGRFVGRVTAAGPDRVRVALAGTKDCPVAGLVNGVAGLVVRRFGRLWLTGLPVGAWLAAGQNVATADGCWLGRLAADPAPDPAGLTAAAPLTDCAKALGTQYYLTKS